MTTLTKYSPVISPVDSLFNRISRELFPAFDRVLSPVNGEWAASRLPRTTIYESPNAFVLKLEMAGLSRKDVEISVEGDSLKVSGEWSVNLQDAQVLHDEIRSNRYERVFNLPHGVDRNNITASMQDGILTVTLTKAPEHVGRKIKVE